VTFSATSKVCTNVSLDSFTAILSCPTLAAHGFSFVCLFVCLFVSNRPTSTSDAYESSRASSASHSAGLERLRESQLGKREGKGNARPNLRGGR